MKTKTEAVVFDADGVLFDSLPPHLKICQDLANEFGILKLKVPNILAFKMMVRNGVKVSPMADFFRAVGFPEDLIGTCVERYDNDFARQYTVETFKGVPELLDQISGMRIGMGIVSSNVFDNVIAALGPLRKYFKDEHILTKDRFESKVKGIEEIVRRFGADDELVVYVGDQYSDDESANEAYVRFVGVTYGWCIDETDQHIHLARTPIGILDHIWK